MLEELEERKIILEEGSRCLPNFCKKIKLQLISSQAKVKNCIGKPTDVYTNWILLRCVLTLARWSPEVNSKEIQRV